MALTTIRGSTRGVRIAAAVSLAMTVAAVSAGCGGGSSTPPTVHVQRGSVSTKVSASGALAAITSQNLGFAKAGQISELDVKVGDVVRPGQVLARQDPFPLQQVLNQQKAQLANQQAQLDKLINSPNVHGDHRTVDQSQRIVDALEKSRDTQLKLDQKTIDQARQKLEADQNACHHSSFGLTSGSANDGSGADNSGSSFGDILNFGHSPMPPMGGRTNPCSAIKQDQADLDTAIQKYRNDKAAADVEIQRAKLQVVTAQNQLDNDKSDRGPMIDAQAALVAAQRAVVAAAQRDVDNTVLYAPVGGTVSAINGNVGEWIGASSSTTSLAPGSTAAIPGVGAAATSDQSSASSAISATRPGGGAFIVLNNVNSFQVVVPFEESDAAKIAPNQKVTVTFDAIPDLERDGVVLSVAPNGVNISGVTNYYATILLTNTDPRLRNGLTAECAVKVQEVDNVLTVPNAAVIHQGGKSYVNVPGPDGKPVQREFQPGLVGDENTQVLSGLNEGQVINMPQAQVSGSPAPSGGRGTR